MQLRIAIFLVSALLCGAIKYFTVSANLPKLGYRVHIISTEGREAEFASGILCLVFWCGLFLFDLFVPTDAVIDPRIFTLLMGWMAGISISTIYTVKLMPRGFYEKGILTENKAVFYEQIDHHTVTVLKKKGYRKYTFYLKNDSRGKLNLFIPNADQKKADQLLRKYKL